MAKTRIGELPATLRAARVMMFAVAALSLVWAVALLVGFGMTAENLGAATVTLLPGAASLYLALRMTKGGRRIRTAIIVLQVVWILIAFGRIGQGDPTGVLGVIVPGTVLILVTRQAARDFFSPTGYF